MDNTRRYFPGPLQFLPYINKLLLDCHVGLRCISNYTKPQPGNLCSPLQSISTLPCYSWMPQNSPQACDCFKDITIPMSRCLSSSRHASSYHPGRDRPPQTLQLAVARPSCMPHYLQHKLCNCYRSRRPALRERAAV